MGRRRLRQLSDQGLAEMRDRARFSLAIFGTQSPCRRTLHQRDPSPVSMHCHLVQWSRDRCRGSERCLQGLGLVDLDPKDLSHKDSYPVRGRRPRFQTSSEPEFVRLAGVAVGRGVLSTFRIGAGHAKQYPSTDPGQCYGPRRQRSAATDAP